MKNISDVFSKIDAYLFKYNDKAQKLYSGSPEVDDKAHVGIMAQELAQNPITENAVDKDENGYLEVNTEQLIMALTAVVADISKQLIEIKDEIENLKGNDNAEL